MNMWVQKLKLFILVAFLQLRLAGMDLISKATLNDGTSNYVLVVYRHAVATVVITPFAIFLDRRTRPKMTLPVFIRLMALGLLETVIDQNLYYLGIKHTTATFGASMSNVVAPWRKWDITGREDAIEYAKKHNVPILVTKKSIQGRIRNLWHLTH